ncbi:MAG: glycosyltransferase family 4 protein [Acidobacteria bacterium]|nr:glycosyltransferase family 4 protein [Acidobacteriota bacterium]
MPDKTYRIGLDARKLQDFGIGTYVRNLIRALAATDGGGLGLRYALLVRPDDREQLADLPGNFELVVESAPVYSLREQLTLSWELWRQRLDLYHATHYVLPAALTSRVVVTIHDIIHLLYPEFLPSRLAFLYARRMIHRSLTRGDRIIAVSQNTRADLMQQFAVDGRKIEVIYNGVADVFRRRLPDAEIERSLHSLGISRPYLLFVGNPKPHKNLDTVVQAYARARRLAQFDAPLVCVGARTGSEFKIRQRAEHLGMGDHVRLLGHVAQEVLPAVYQGATLFLYPTLYEGFGLPVIEAMASGVAVITSNTSALKEVAQGYAHLVDPLDIPAMAKAIAQCMSDSDHRAALARLGLRRAQDFRWERTARKTLGVYRAALGLPAAPPAADTGAWDGAGADGEARTSRGAQEVSALAATSRSAAAAGLEPVPALGPAASSDLGSASRQAPAAPADPPEEGHR